jgi:hypothetical protein
MIPAAYARVRPWQLQLPKFLHTAYTLAAPPRGSSHKAHKPAVTEALLEGQAILRGGLAAFAKNRHCPERE